MIIAQNKFASTFYFREGKMLVSVYKWRAINGLILEHLADIAEFYKKNQVLSSVVEWM